jgi:hypothetical protein
MENRPTREAALARMAEIERELAKLEAQDIPATEQQVASLSRLPMTGGAFMPPTRQTIGEESMAEAEAIQREKMSDLGKASLRYGVPLAVGIATGGASIPIQIAAGSASAALGETGAQTFEDGDYRKGEIAGAFLRGAAPVFKGASGLAKTVGGAGLSGLLGGAAEGKVTGLGSGAKEFAYGALPAGILQGAGTMLGANRQRLTGGITRSQDIERIAPGQIKATFGQAFPEFAGLEARVASQTGSQELNQQLLDQSRAVANAVQKITGIPAEAHSDLVSRIAQTFGGLSPETGARLANEAQGVNDAFFAVERARSAAQKSVAQDALAEAQQSFQKSVEMETLKGGIRTGAVGPYQVVPAGTRIEEIGEKAKEVIQTEARRLYGPANAVEDVPAFDLYTGVGKEMSFADRATAILNRIPDIPTSALTDVRRILARKTTAMAAPSMDPTAAITVGTPQKATFKEIQGIRNELYDFADYSGEAIGNKAQAEIRKLAGSITDTVTDQAPKTLGQDVADSIKAGEEFYGATRPKLDVFGVKRAFIPQTMERGQMGKAAVEGVRSQGVLAPEFANLEDLFSTLQKRGVKDAPNMQPVIDDIRFGIIDGSMNKATGQYDLMKLAGDLNNISQQGGNGLQKLGFGTKSELNRFVQYMQNLDPATIKGPEVVLDLLKSGTPAGFAVASRAVQMLPDLATVDSVLKSLEKQAVKGSKAAGETLLNIRAREIENILLEASKTGPKPNLGSLIELTNPEMRQKVQLILGPKLLKTIDDVFVPGFRVMETARESAGMAGSTVRGAAVERLGKAALEAPIQMASGDLVKPAVNLASKLGSTLGYAYWSRVLAKGAGVSGLRDRKQFYGLLKQIAEKPQPQQLQLLRRYADEDRSE